MKGRWEQGGVTPIDSIVTAATALSQQSNRPNRLGQRSKQSQKDSQGSDPTADYCAVIRPKPVRWGYTWMEHLFPDIQACVLGLQFKYQDSFECKILSGQRSMAKN